MDNYKRTIDIMTFIPISASMDPIVTELGHGELIEISYDDTGFGSELTVDFGKCPEEDAKRLCKIFDDMANALSSPPDSEGEDNIC